MDKDKLTPEEQFYIDEQMYFTEELNNQTDRKVQELHVEQKKNRDDILSEIAKLMLSYNIVKELMDIKRSDKIKLGTKLDSLVNEKIKSELTNENKVTGELLKYIGKEKYSVNNYIYSLGTENKKEPSNITKSENNTIKTNNVIEKENIREITLDDIINRKVNEKLWSDRLWANKNKIAKDLRSEIRDFLDGKTTVNEIEARIKKKYNTNAYETKRLVQDNATRVQEGVNEKWQQYNGIKYVMYMATLDGHVCSKCYPYDSKVFELNKKPVSLPQHPFCRCTYVSLPNKNWHPKMRLDNETKQNINWQSYEEWKKNYIENNPERLANHKMIKNKSSDKRIYEKYNDILGKEMPKTLEDFQKLKYNNINEWDLMKDYVKSRSNNMISVFNSFSDYKLYKNKINNEIVGLTTSNGIGITGQSKHFIERVFGTTEDPHTGRPRSGVEINHIKDAIENGKIRTRKDDPNSIKFVNSKCIVSINPNTGNLIQVNPQ